MKRRSFIKGFAAFVAVAAIPAKDLAPFVSEARITNAVDLPDIPAGNYTFSVYVRHPNSANWVKIERDFIHPASGPLSIRLFDMIENADRVTSDGIVSSGPPPSEIQLRFAQLEQSLPDIHYTRAGGYNA